MSERFYKVYGLHVCSALKLPELEEVEETIADVNIRVGSVPSSLPNAARRTREIDVGKKTYLLRVPGVARYLVEGGRRITLQPLSDETLAPKVADVRLFLLGSAFGALVHQRGLLPLHIAAILTADGITGFTGPSGAGKSTLAGWFLQRRGVDLFSDDVSVLCPNDDRLMLHPGPRRLKLWHDALDLLGFDRSQARQDLSNTPKYQVWPEHSKAPPAAPLVRMVELARGEKQATPSLERLRGSEAFDVVMRSIYRPATGGWFQDSGKLVRSIASICSSIEVQRFSRSWSLERLSSDLEFLETQLRASGSASTTEPNYFGTVGVRGD